MRTLVLPIAVTFAFVSGACASSHLRSQEADSIRFVEHDGDAQIHVDEVGEDQLRFRWLSPLSGERDDCTLAGIASAVSATDADPEMRDGPEGETFAGREYWHAPDTHCMLSLVVELEPTRWLQVERFDCVDGKGCLPTATRVFRRTESSD